MVTGALPPVSERKRVSRMVSCGISWGLEARLPAVVQMEGNGDSVPEVTWKEPSDGVRERSQEDGCHAGCWRSLSAAGSTQSTSFRIGLTGK